MTIKKTSRLILSNLLDLYSLPHQPCAIGTLLFQKDIYPHKFLSDSRQLARCHLLNRSIDSGPKLIGLSHGSGSPGIRARRPKCTGATFFRFFSPRHLQIQKLSLSLHPLSGISNQPGAVVQLVRMPACHAGGRGFESLPHRKIPFQDVLRGGFCFPALRV